MSIQYTDGTFGPTKSAEAVAKDLLGHFTGEKQLPMEPERVLFGRDAEMVEMMKEKAAAAEQMEERLAALERTVGIQQRGIVRTPTADDVAKYAAVTP